MRSSPWSYSSKRQGLVLPVMVACMIFIISLYSIYGSVAISKNLRQPNLDFLCQMPLRNDTLTPVISNQEATTESSGQEPTLEPTRPIETSELTIQTAPTTNGTDLPYEELSARRQWTLKAASNFHLDVGVPISGQDEKLVNFAKHYGRAIQEFHDQAKPFQPVDFRLLVTRYPSDDASSDFLRTLASAAKVETESIIFVTANETGFHRAKAINLLHDHTRNGEKMVLAITDVDMLVGPRFLYNSLRIVSIDTMYFPIVFSDYRPSSVLLVEQFLGPQTRYSEHHGLWRDFGYGMYAIAGEAAGSCRMDETFSGWGGEDLNFYNRAKEKFQITRTKEYDLIHVWHPKYCDLGSFVNEKNLNDWSRDSMEGSSFARLLLKIISTEPGNFEKLYHSSQRLVVEFATIRAVADREYEPGKSPEEMPAVIPLRVRGPKAEGILIGVTASRATFSTRVAEIVNTWASNLPKGVFVRFFVGDPVGASELKSGSEADIAYLAKQANISDNSTIAVMKGVRDDEYPLVQKAAAVLRYMDKAILSLKRQSRKNKIDWVFDVDDDTYVNVEALQEFLFKKSHRKHTYIGQRGEGAVEDREMLRNAGLKKPYCMGGAGIIMAKDTFRMVVDHIKGCIDEASKTQTILYDDVLIGMCLQRRLGLGCWDDPSYNPNTFAHNFHASDSFPSDANLWTTVSLHPHKTPGMMNRTHERFKNFGISTHVVY